MSDVNPEESTSVPAAEPLPAAKPGNAKLRLILLGVGILVLFLISHEMGWLDDKRAMLEKLKSIVQNAGIWGFVLFLALYFAGELVHIPGIIFFITGIYVWGPVWGALAGYVGSLIASVAIFFVVRRVGGDALSSFKNKWIRTVLEKLEQHPIRIIVILRTILWNAPQLNYAFALSRVKFRDYALGSMVGLILPVIIQAVFLDKVIALALGRP